VISLRLEKEQLWMASPTAVTSLLPSAGSKGVNPFEACAQTADEKPVNGQLRMNVMGVPIEPFNLQEATSLVAGWARGKTATKLVTFTNVHMLTESHHHPQFHSQLCEMDLNCPDGMPLVWLAKASGRRISRVCGPEFFEEFFASTADQNLRHFFYGGNEGVAGKVAAELKLRYPTLQVAGFAAPPFRPLTEDEDAYMVDAINNSGADVVWVSLGCPKQESWMHEHRSKLKPCVVLAVGMAFDILVGNRQRAPEVLRNAGLEWLYRLMKEPRRLGSRYLKSNFTFLFLLARTSTGSLLYNRGRFTRAHRLQENGLSEQLRSGTSSVRHTSK
jgi:N-acetylglucosaminyldiphosphoundecaprenol N-acetyl-beta-D-mannosaminyltransferase